MIRLQRTGRKNEPTFRLVLTDKRNGTSSNKFVDVLGSYDSRRKDEIMLKADKIKEWIGKGAQPSDTVRNMLIEAGIIEGKKVNVLPSKSPVVDEEAVKKAEEEAAAKAEAEKAAAEAKASEDGSSPDDSSEESVREEKAPEPAAEESKTEETPKEEEKKEEPAAEEDLSAQAEKKEE